jgi:signal transduction histidine kinase/CheY-like chemotaxis protein
MVRHFGGMLIRLRTWDNAMGLFTQIFDTTDFPPRWHCGSWTSPHGWLHILSDLGVWSAYLAIPMVLGYFILRKKDLPFRKIFLLFGAFIFACGTTHLMEAIIFWWPAYRLAGLIKLSTAVVSWATVIALAPVVPKVLAMRSPEELQKEIEARKKADEELLRANAELERRVEERTRELAAANAAMRVADLRKNEFLATLAHELRNPLAPISNGLQILQFTSDEATASEVYSIMSRQLKQMIRLVDDLLDLSRIDRNKLELRRKPTDLAMIVNHAVETSRPLVEANGHELSVSLPAGEVTVDADVVRLSQVISNLLNNAAKYTEAGGQIWLSAEERDGQAVITVRDTGIGIASEMLGAVFEMFAQADRSLERSQGGLGIGLTLVKRIVEMHDGTVEAHSPGLGQGSEFVVRLPRSAEVVAGDVENRQQDRASGDSRRVLVVDDNVDSALSLSKLLCLQGHVTKMAHDGLEAVAAAAEFKPAIILLDLGMPKLNGYDACRRIRSLPGGRSILIAALTGWGQDNDRQRTAEAGFDHHLVKPVDSHTLRKLIAELGAKANGAAS